MNIVFHYGLANLPNIEGYRFRGWLHNGDLIPCIVKRSGSGLHYAAHEHDGRGVYDHLKGWTPYTDEPVSETNKLPEPTP